MKVSKLHLKFPYFFNSH